MADPFTPKFADLVRNTTTTVGTGDFVLGPPVNGFTGFMAALDPGDSFYYSAIGVDRPSEREIGRGTLQSNGTITRQPISGLPTNFSSGTKTIALVAAAEWFQNVQSGGGTAGSGQASAATRDELSGLSPASQVAMLHEGGREGLFVFDSGNRSADVSRDPAQGVFVAPASAPTGASGAWVRKHDGHLNAAWFGGLPGTDLAPVMRNILTFAGDTAVSVFLPPSETPYLWNSKVDWTACVHLFSLSGPAATLAGVVAGFLHGAIIQVASGVTAIVPQKTELIYADFASFSGITFRATAKNTTSTTGSIAQDTRVLTLAAAQDFANGQIVRVRGAGPSGYLQGNGLRGATTNGSAVIACTGLPANIGAVPGQVLNVGSAFPAQTYVLSVDNVARTITMSANATSTVSATRISIYGDLYGYVISGGGTTTLNLNGTAHRTVSGARVEHFDSAIFGFNSYVINGCTAEDFQGCAFGLAAGGRYLNPDGVSSTNANTLHWNGANIRECTNGVVIDGTDANASHFDNINCLSATEWAIVDQSLLGNLWTNTHASGGYGILHVIDAASQSQFDWAYTEGGTVNSFASSACGNGYQSDDEDGGLRFIPVNGSLGMPPMRLFPYHYGSTYGTWFLGTRRNDLNVAGVIHAELSAIGGSNGFQIFDSHRPGLVGITDTQAGKTLLGFTMANHARGAGHTLINSLYLGNAQQGSDSIVEGNFRRVLTGSAAPTTGSSVAGDIVINSAPTAGAPLLWRCVASGTPGTWEAISASSGASAVKSQSGAAYTAVLADANSYIRFTSGSAIAFTVPPNSSVAFPIGTVLEIEQAGAGALSVVAGAGVTINSRGADLTLAGQFAVAALKKVAADSWTLTGDL